MNDKWSEVLEALEDVHGIDLPFSLKKDAVRICDHLYRQNPERGRFDAGWSLAKVADYLEGLIEPFKAARFSFSRPIPRKDH